MSQTACEESGDRKSFADCVVLTIMASKKSSNERQTRNKRQITDISILGPLDYSKELLLKKRSRIHFWNDDIRNFLVKDVRDDRQPPILSRCFSSGLR